MRGGFVTKFNPGGSGLVYSTFVAAGSVVYGITLDAQGDAYVAGSVQGNGLPPSPDAFQSVNHGGPANGFDAFVAKFNAVGSGLIYSTYLGGNYDDGAAAVAVDPTGDLYVTGSTSSLDFPTTPGAFQSKLGDSPGGPGGWRRAKTYSLPNSRSAVRFVSYKLFRKLGGAPRISYGNDIRKRIPRWRGREVVCRRST